MNDHDHDHMPGGMAGGAHAPAPPMHQHHMMMHMTFFWGKNTEILFHGWPGYDRPVMYALALAVVFVLAAAIEWMSASDMLRGVSDHWAAGMLRTVLHAVRIGLAYLVMLAVMSFNAGVFLAAVAGHGAGFFLFARKKFEKRTAVESGKVITSDLPPLNCC